VFSMTVNITPEDERIIQEKLRTGAFRSAEEVIHRALVSLPTPPSRPLNWYPFSQPPTRAARIMRWRSGPAATGDHTATTPNLGDVA
jgi:Arc/MetJ-type ribon-helix-helix transcriptional regulator